ncbi:MAG: type II toxin-antitoxin system RelE/ParE family toxin [Gammaproteobacteria bacterium]|nr:type II toxin-antitoxin system RelE/ParE family toxin [Gammaproteobacteria bacterium]
MEYAIRIKKQAKKKLESMPRNVRAKIIDKINDLGHNPDDPTLDVKRLIGEPYYRLRVGDWRIIFDREDVLKIIFIERIKPRGDVYK